MKRILYIICSLFLQSTICSISWALPDCDSNAVRWDNCVGTYTWDNGDKYSGEWKNDKMHGYGTYTVGNLGTQGNNTGDKYVGEWLDGKYHGQGTYIHLNGDKYVGEYKDGRMHGKGVYTFASGTKYVGEYRDGKRNGQFTVTYSTGVKYVGEFKNDKKHGHGTQYNADGTILKEGIFKDGVFQYAQKKSSNNSNSNPKLNKYKEFCEEIGFKLGTEKFADCVLKTMEKD